HRGLDRRYALSDTGAAGARRYLSRPAELQAAIRAAVSAGADRSSAVDGFLHGGRRCDRHGCDVVVRLRYRKLASVLPLDAGFFAGLPDRGQGALVEDAKPVRADPVFRRHRATRLDLPLDP